MHEGYKCGKIRNENECFIFWMNFCMIAFVDNANENSQQCIGWGWQIPATNCRKPYEIATSCSHNIQNTFIFPVILISGDGGGGRDAHPCTRNFNAHTFFSIVNCAISGGGIFQAQKRSCWTSDWGAHLAALVYPAGNEFTEETTRSGNFFPPRKSSGENRVETYASTVPSGTEMLWLS